MVDNLVEKNSSNQNSNNADLKHLAGLLSQTSKLGVVTGEAEIANSGTTIDNRLKVVQNVSHLNLFLF